MNVTGNRLFPKRELVKFLRRLAIKPGLFFFHWRPNVFRVRSSMNGIPTIWIDVSRAHTTKRTTGIERVVRELSSALSEVGAGEGIEVQFVVFRRSGMSAIISPNWLQGEGDRREKSAKKRVTFRPGDVLFGLDLSLAPIGPNQREVRFLNKRGVRTYHVVYDVLPITHPQFFPKQKKQIFSYWLKSVSEGAGLIYISLATKRRTQLALRNRNLPLPQEEAVIRLGAFRRPLTKVDNSSESNPFFIAVGTLEPRKDYEGLLDAFEIYWARGGSAGLTIVGKEGWSCEELTRRLYRHPDFGGRLRWKSNADDSELARLISSSVGLVANSVDEGFGLPLIEAANLGVPVIARDIEVFKEIAPWATFYGGTRTPTLVDSLLNGQTGALPPRDYLDDLTLEWNKSAEAILRRIGFIQDGASFS